MPFRLGNMNPLGVGGPLRQKNHEELLKTPEGDVPRRFFVREVCFLEKNQKRSCEPWRKRAVHSFGPIPSFLTKCLKILTTISMLFDSTL